MSKKVLWFCFAFFAICIGLYPLIYFITEIPGGLLTSKSAELLKSTAWWTAFYLHISFGGLSLLVGWSQFSAAFRTKHLTLHRNLGKLFILSVFLSGLSAFYLSFFATAGWVSSWGFGTLAILWLGTTLISFIHIKNKRIEEHKQWMIRAYALTFAAVSLRLWMPVFLAGFQMDFMDAYPIIAWICWVPNFLVAELIIWRIKTKNL